MNKAKGRHQNERGLVDMDASSDSDEPPWPPAGGATHEETEDIYLGEVDGFELRLISRTIREDKGGRLLDFAVSLQALEEDHNQGLFYDVPNWRVGVDRI